MRVAAALALVSLLPLSADDQFEKTIRPLLAEKCYGCHSAKVRPPKGGLRLDTAAGIRKGGDSGPAITPGDMNSRLLRAVSYRDLDLKMPPTGRLSGEQIETLKQWVAGGATMPAEAAEAESARPVLSVERGRRYWAFQPLRRGSPSDSVDSFLQMKLREKGLRQAPETDRRTWLRRLTFDLTGLPPTREELRDFLADTSISAHAKVIDRLLASPRYGERWARHWLDLVRFAETNGHEFDNDKLDAWRYRDYVIRAFNLDVPYTQFVREHIAGDLLAKPRLTEDGSALESPLGTSAFWFGEVLNSATDSVKSRADQVDNQIDVMSKAFLGLTMACARCHDHKFDPLPTADYYSLAGYFHSTTMREAVIDSPERAKAIAAAHARIADYNEQIRKLVISSIPTPQGPPLKLRTSDILFAEFDSFDGWSASGEAFRPGPRREVAPNQPLADYAGESMASSFGAGTERLVGSLTSAKFKMPKLWVHVRLAGSKTDKALRDRSPLRVTVVADDHKSEHFFPDGSPGFVWKSMRMTKEIGRSCYFEIVDRSREGHIAVDKIVFSDEQKPPEAPDAGEGAPRLEDGVAAMPENWRNSVGDYQARRAAIEAAFPESAWGMIASDENPGDVRVHIRGSHKNLGAVAPRRPPQVLCEGALPVEGSGRLALAEWMARDENALLARVMVNRVWQHHFGRGLVATVDNFGMTGDRPSHPELLDWLAARFVESGWSVKALHRLILNSAAYRMSSKATEAAAQADPQNRLLHHMPVRRLEGEAIRDAMLAVSGSLDTTMFGPGVPPHISKYQDGRGKPASGPLDGGNRRSLYLNVRRNFLPPMFLAFDYPLPVSTTGARNTSTVPSQALLLLNNEFVAEMARRWGARTTDVDAMYESAFARPPEDQEPREALAFAEKHGWGELAHVLLNSAEFLYVP